MKGIICCDIDDSLVRFDGEIGVWKRYNGKETRLTSDEFAKDPDRERPGVEYDFREFEDPKIARDSIIRGTPLIGNLRIVDQYLDKGFDFAFLTARSQEDVVTEAIADFMRHNVNGELRPLGRKFQRTLSYAVSDPKYMEVLDGLTSWERKARVLKWISEDYDEVVFLDDDFNNLEAARNLRLPNLTVIKALHENQT